MPEAMAISTRARVELTHAVLQRLAERCGADLLHIKGPAVAPELLACETVDGTTRVIPRHSTDADVLVRPEHLSAFERELHLHQWDKVANFRDGSAFGHAANYWHPLLGYADIHRKFPGIEIDASVAFETMWSRRLTVDIAHMQLSTPGIDDQRLVLLLHAARSGYPDHPDKTRCWDDADPATHDRVRSIAEEMDANVALAAAIGELENYRDHRTYDLWRQFSTADSSRLHEWRARVRAAPNRIEAVRVALSALALNRPHLRMDLGHDLTRADIARGYADRVARAAGEIAGELRARRHR